MKLNALAKPLLESALRVKGKLEREDALNAARKAVTDVLLSEELYPITPLMILMPLLKVCSQNTCVK